MFLLIIMNYDTFIYLFRSIHLATETLYSMAVYFAQHFECLCGQCGLGSHIYILKVTQVL